MGGLSRWSITEYFGEYVSFVRTEEFNMDINKQAPLLTLFAHSERELAGKLLDNISRAKKILNSRMIGKKGGLMGLLNEKDGEELSKTLNQLQGYLQVTDRNYEQLIDSIAPNVTEEEINEVRKSITS